MSRGFYAAASAMMADMERFNVMSNNLANVNTHGYKRQQTIHHDFRQGFIERINNRQNHLQSNESGPDTMAFSEASDVRIGELGTGTLVQNSWTDFSNGALENTGSDFDVALQGDGFFVVRGADGNDYYTRHGGFQLDAKGYLVNANGLTVQSQGGSIQIGQAKNVQIDSEGKIYADGTLYDQIKQVRFEEPQLLMNQGNNLFARLPQQNELASGNVVKQGYLERSNVNVASEMVTMISALRSYQISQKALQSEDEMTGKLINEVGRPSA